MKTTLPYQQQTKRPCELSSQTYIQSHALSFTLRDAKRHAGKKPLLTG